MSTVVGTDDYSDHDSVEVWHQLVGEYVQPTETSARPNRPFRAQMQIGQIGSIEVLDVTATPYVVHRTQRQIARSRGFEQIFCSLQLAGPHLIVQDGREMIRYPGDLVIFDPCYPCTLVCGEPVHFLAFVFPRKSVGSDLEALVQGAATVLPSGQGIGALVTSFLRQLAEQLRDVRPSAAARLSDHTLDLLSTFFADLLGTEPGIGGAVQRSLVLQAKAHIEANLANPNLSPATVAAAHHVSVRYLQKLFETHGLTISGWIRERRLEHARRDLTDPAQYGVPLTTIANRWKFADSAHFSRVFKAAYGLSPRGYRSTSNPIGRISPFDGTIPASHNGTACAEFRRASG